jgi:hypothetical protein
MDDGEREGDRDRCVDGVATTTEDVTPDFTRDRTPGDHHRTRRGGGAGASPAG